ncbi:MAG: MarR family winged helix-turn-helix transcriptional regulator [Bacteroidota bacterium]
MVHHIDRIMRRIDGSMHRRMPEVDVDRIGPLGCIILTVLSRIEPAPIQRLVDQLCRDGSQMTRAIKKLEASGLIEKHRDEHDGRITVLTLTAKGRVFVAEVLDIMEGIVADLLLPLSPTERKQFADLLAKL